MAMVLPVVGGGGYCLWWWLVGCRVLPVVVEYCLVAVGYCLR